MEGRVIGIDPGTHTGIAVWNRGRTTLEMVDTMPIHRALDYVRRYADGSGGDVIVYFEDARQRVWIPKERDIRQVKGRAMGAGSVKRDSTIWEDALTDWGIPFHAVAPKHNMTKMTPEYFRALTGWKGRTSEHSRDAAMLVFGR